jgi:hypothetical protein
MKRILIIIGFIGAVLSGNTTKAQTYQIGIDSLFGLPDTIVDGEEYTFFVVIGNYTPLAYQGDINVGFTYNGGDSLLADSTSFAALPFLANDGSLNATVKHRFETGGPSTLSIGINVVVVWPRLGSGNEPPQEILQPYEQTLFIVEPNSVRAPDPNHFSVYPNPSAGIFELNAKAERRIEQVRLIGLSGRILQTWNSIGSSYAVNDGLKGNFILEVMYEDGQFGRQLFVLH